MKKLNLKVEYGLKYKPGEVVVPEVEISVNWLTYTVVQKYKDGLDGQLRRIWGRIQRKFDEAVDSQTNSKAVINEIELEEAEVDFLVKSFNECVFPVKNAMHMCLLEEEIDKLSKPDKSPGSTA